MILVRTDHPCLRVGCHRRQRGGGSAEGKRREAAAWRVRITSEPDGEKETGRDNKEEPSRELAM
jgi:hypothetical protein